MVKTAWLMTYNSGWDQIGNWAENKTHTPFFLLQEIKIYIPFQTESCGDGKVKGDLKRRSCLLFCGVSAHVRPRNRTHEKIHDVSKHGLTLKSRFCGLESYLAEFILNVLGPIFFPTQLWAISQVGTQHVLGQDSSTSLSLARLSLHLLGPPWTVSESNVPAIRNSWCFLRAYPDLFHLP